MEKQVNKKKKTSSILLNIFASAGLIIIAFIAYVFIVFCFYFDGGWNTYLNDLCFLAITVVGIILIWNTKYFRILLFVGAGAFVVLVGNVIYLKNFSVKVEPLIYLHQKYIQNYNYF